jgi:potassium/hydrogen antiporter
VVLATAGTVITALVAGLAASVIFDIPIALGLLVGAIISSTDAAAVFSVLRSRGMGLRGRLRPLLELESASNDPMAVFLTIGFTALVTQPDASVVGFAWLFVRQMTLGAVTGIVLALLAVRLVNWLRLEYEGSTPSSPWRSSSASSRRPRPWGGARSSPCTWRGSPWLAIGSSTSGA